MRPHSLLALLWFVALGCESAKPSPTNAESPGEAGTPASRSSASTPGAPAEGAAAPTLAEARRSFETKLVRPSEPGEPPPTPPADGDFRLVRFDAPPGPLAAYVTKDPGDGKRHPAIVWLTGGDTNTIGPVWSPGPRDDEQTASAYREAGLVMMFPSQRGGNDNPGRREGFLGEVDDVLAAADHLSKLSYVDPERIYLGGHSTGGTLALLAAETSDRFRAVFSFGPVASVAGYGPQFVWCDPADTVEIAMRSPLPWLAGIRTPVFAFEGDTDGNGDSLTLMERYSKNPHIRFFVVAGTDHFGILAPVNELIARRIASDTGATSTLAFTKGELDALFAPKSR